jgi:glycerol-3-phosphate acyltransferase PlsY
VVLAIVTGVLIYIRHHENIARLLKGVEPRIGAAKT